MAATGQDTPVRENKANNYHCCVYGCNSNGRYDTHINFHKFPKDEQLRKTWIVKIRRDIGEFFQISGSTVVCSKHFTGWTPLKRKLKPGTVPSVFDWSKERTPRRKLNRKELSSPGPSPKRLKCEDSSNSALMDVQPSASEDKFSAVPLWVEQQTEIKSLKEQLERKAEECEDLKKQLTIERFGISRFNKNDKMIQFYTGFTSYMMFITFFRCIEPSASNIRSKYYEAVETVSLAGRPRMMLLIDELFMFMCRLRVGHLEQDLSVRFNCSIATVSRKILTWVNFLYLTLGRIPIWPSRQVIDETMPHCFRDIYPKTRVIIDCTEIKTQIPSSLVLNSQFYSHYKGSCTFKCLLGIAPNGMVTFISSLFTGCMSDVEITQLSGILDLLEPGDDVMADKGFTLKKLLNEKNVTLNIPPFLKSSRKFSTTEIKETEEIARLRIHIERVNRRIKEYHLFDTPVPIVSVGSTNQLWTVACLLSNFKGPIVKSWSSSADSST